MSKPTSRAITGLLDKTICELTIAELLELGILAPDNHKLLPSPNAGDQYAVRLSADDLATLAGLLSQNSMRPAPVKAPRAKKAAPKKAGPV